MGDVMWKNISKAIKDWAYEEVEVEVEVYKNQQDEHTQGNAPTPKAKMTYKYPQNAPFKFPTMQDGLLKAGKETMGLHKTKRTMNNSNRGPNISTAPLHYYGQRKDLTKVENVPAYLRKQRERKEVFNEQTTTEVVENLPKKITRGSTPDELDAIFKKKDKKVEPIMEVVKEKPIIITKENTISLSEIPEIIDDPYIHIEESIEPEDKVIENIEKKHEQITLSHSNVVENYRENDLPLHLLNDIETSSSEDNDMEWLTNQSTILEETLTRFNVGAKVVNVTQGPTVTSFEVKPDAGVKVSRIRNLSDDLKLNLSAKDIRIQAPIPGKNTVGIEVPNKKRQTVSFQEVITNKKFTDNTSPLPIALGLTVEGEPLITTINEMPHGLIAGSTGSGKSVCINTILLSLIYNSHHDEVKFLLIDPKMIELSPYNGIPHLVSPVITDAKAATAALKWAVNEMEDRYKRFVDLGVRDISRFNDKVETKEERMPYLVIVIDELADLMMVSPQDVEDSICRIAQKARACGIHLLVATQRPSVDVITGLIKANIPTRIAFSVSSQIDSRTILDIGGAEKLLGKGDMLFMENGSNKLLRLQGPFVSDEEIERVTRHVRSIAEPKYLFEQSQLLESLIAEEEEDELLGEVILFIVEHNRASTSLLQRRFRIGYNRAARIIDTLEYKGLISVQNGSKPRDVLIDKAEAERIYLQLEE